MKNRFFQISFALVLTVLICFQSFGAYAADSYLSVNGFVFDFKSDSEVVIHGYDGSGENVSIPATLMGAKVCEIDKNAFFGNTRIKTLSFENAIYLSKIGSNAFNGCSALMKVTLPASVTELGFGTFQKCSGLESVTINSSVSAIPAQCFYGCEKLNNVVIPDSVGKIGDFAFGKCSELDDITVPDSVTSISSRTFSGSGNVRIFCSKDSYARGYAENRGVDTVITDNYSAGDVDLSGSIDINDVTYMQMYKVGLIKLGSNFQEKLADANCDGKTNLRDATYIQMRLAGLVENI